MGQIYYCWPALTHGSISKLYHYYLYARADMQWLADPRAYLPLVYASSSSTPTAYVPDTENYWGVNDRFAILNAAAADAYFVARASLQADAYREHGDPPCGRPQRRPSRFAGCRRSGRALCVRRRPACVPSPAAPVDCASTFGSTTRSAHPQGFTICVKYI